MVRSLYLLFAKACAMYGPKKRKPKPRYPRAFPCSHLAALATLALAVSIFLELGAGYDTHAEAVGLNTNWENPRAVARVRAEFDNGLIFEYDHHSSVFRGYPFNSLPETNANQWSVLYRIQLK